MTYLRAMYQGKEQPGWLKFVHEWENILFSFFAAILLIAVFGTAARAKALIPGPMQNAAEALFGGLHDFFLGILGPGGKAYVPFLGSLFLYIVTMNWLGMIPFLKSPNTSLNTTFALALVRVRLRAVHRHHAATGSLGYLDHLPGSPRTRSAGARRSLLFPIQIMGEFVKPISLCCRLFGNIFGEDMLLVVFVALGVTALSFVHSADRPAAAAAVPVPVALLELGPGASCSRCSARSTSSSCCRTTMITRTTRAARTRPLTT